MTTPWISALFALFIWWFSTGMIMLAVRRADRSGGHLGLVLLALPMLVIGVGFIGASKDMQTLAGVYQGFLGALAIWGWIELAFLAGVITGPVKAPAVPHAQGMARFSRAFGTVAHHEFLLLVGLFVVIVATAGGSNRMAIATYVILFIARICAKLNLFYGVPRINTEFVPAKLSYLTSYFRRGPITLAFPVAITVLTIMLAICAERLWSATDTVTATGFALLTALSTLALIEHWLMVVPLPDAKLWRWMLPAARPQDPRRKT